ncbi:MAG: HAMP domain-containing protein [Phycisphaera sp.]|nr:HAMP domain-containing protein [Phycisphaera sp.]
MSRAHRSTRSIFAILTIAVLTQLLLLTALNVGARAQAAEASHGASSLHTKGFDLKPSPDEVLELLTTGNERFVAGQSLNPHTDAARLAQAGSEDQGNHALVTVITCSDSRVPVERVFDMGVMDIFVIRVAGNVCDTDEIGSIEYGLAHVNTPVLVVLGHTQCGAVTAVTKSLKGADLHLEENIPPLVDNIAPAVQRAMTHNHSDDAALIADGIVENVWQSISDLFQRSPSTRQLVKMGKVKVVGAIYDVATGRVKYLDANKPAQLLAAAEMNPAPAASSHNTASQREPSAAAVSTHPAEKQDISSLVTHDMQGWVATIGAPGSFSTPELVKDKRQAFGSAAGNAQKLEPQALDEHTSTIVTVFWGLTTLALVGTLFAGFLTAKIKDAKGHTVRGFTMASKLSLAFGGMATMLLLVGTFALSSSDTSDQVSDQFSDIVSDAGLLEEVQTSVVNLRMQVKDFLLNNSDEALQKYSDAASEVSVRIDKAHADIHSPDRVKMIDEIDKLLENYEEKFAEVVGVIDERNGIVESQLNKAGPRLGSVIGAIIDTANIDGDMAVQIEANNAVDHLNAARVAVMKFLRTSEKADAQNAITSLKEGEEIMARLEGEVQNPTRKKWLAEAKMGYQFYAQRVERLIELVDERNDIVKGHLDAIGPKVATLGAGLNESIRNTEAQLRTTAVAVSASTITRTATVSGIALALAVCVSVLLIRMLTRSVNKVLNVIQAVASGDLTQPLLNMKSKDEMGEMARATDHMSSALQDLVKSVAQASSEVAAASTEIAASSEEIAQGMTEQSSQVSQIASAVEEMSASITEVAGKSTQASQSANDSGQAATDGGKIVDQTVQGMRAINEAVSEGAARVQELGKRGEQIGQIIEVINDIADQTNLLALNAAIEAARAGEHGRGFAVVADEVRKLADRTTKATEEIASSIQAIQEETTRAVKQMNSGTEEVNKGVESATLAGQSLSKIVQSAKDVATMVQSIAAAAEEQSAASTQVSKNVEAISAVTTQSVEGARQAAQAAAGLSEKSERLQEIVGRFKLAA